MKREDKCTRARQLLSSIYVVIALVCSVPLAPPARAQDPEKQRLESANEYLSSRNDISPEFRTAIQQGLVVVGMSPEEASVAGGANIFEVDRDRSVWPKEETDPYRIMSAQRLHPDSSKIKLHFENKRQFGTPEPVRFSAIFAHGRVASIDRGWHLGP